MEVIRYLEQWEKQKTRTLYETAFPEDSQSFVDYYYEWKTADNEILVLEEEESFQVMIHLNPYTLRVGGTMRKVPYIVAVATRPDCRRQGKMGQVMKRALQDMEQKKIPFTFLLPADPVYYEGQGFVFFPRQNQWERTQEPKWKNENLEWKKACLEDIPELVELSNDILQRESQVWIVRDNSYYQRLLAETQVEHGGVLLLRSSGKLQGILVYGMESEAEEKKAAEIKELLLESPVGMEEAKKLCEHALVDCEISFAEPRMMVRIASLEAFVSLLRSSRPRSFVVKVKDSMIPANCGCYRITIDAQGGTLEKVSERCREVDISELAQDLLQEVSVNLKEWV